MEVLKNIGAVALIIAAVTGLFMLSMVIFRFILLPFGDYLFG